METKNSLRGDLGKIEKNIIKFGGKKMENPKIWEWGFGDEQREEDELEQYLERRVQWRREQREKVGK